MNFTDIVPPMTLAGARAVLTGILNASKSAVTNWLGGGVAQQMFEAHSEGAYQFTGLVSSAIRGFASLDTSTDPGDYDPYDDAQISRDPAPGFLSWYGANVFGTPRNEATKARTTITIANAGPSIRTVASDSLVFTKNGTTPAITYRNSYDSSIYTGGGKTLTLGVGASVTIPLTCEIAGSLGNADANTISLTTVLLGVSVVPGSQPAAAGYDRETAEDYRARCRLAPSLLSLNGPQDAYRAIALGARVDADGNVFFYPPVASESGVASIGIGVDPGGNPVILKNPVGQPVGVTRVAVYQNSGTGLVDVYFGGPSGAVPSAVTLLQPLFDAVYWPDCTTRNFHTVSSSVISPAGTIYARKGPGVTAKSVATAANNALALAFPAFPISGYDQPPGGGTGTIYLEELKSIITRGLPGMTPQDLTVLGSVYNAVLTAPAADVSLGPGVVAVLGSSFSPSNVVVS